MTLRICIAGATGWAGSALSRAILRMPDLKLVSGVSRTNSGMNLAEILKVPGANVPLFSSVAEAMSTGCDVFVEYTTADAARKNVRTALEKGANAVIGTSGLTDDDYEELDRFAVLNNRGILAAGNFSILNVIMQKCAELAAKHLPQWEIIDYASAGKIDAPSGTTRELAYRLARIRTPEMEVPLHEMHGPKETRGATINGIQVHSVRLPGYVISAEVLFGELDQRFSLRYDSGSNPDAYVDGALLAIRRVGSFTGLKRGLDSIMDF